jgi:hypothetical protein
MAYIGGSLNCNKATFQNSGNRSLVADGIRVNGVVHLGKGFISNGEVRLVGSRIGDSLDCSGGSFHNAGNRALHADRMEVEGCVFLRNGFQAEGIVDLTKTLIKGYFVHTGVESSEESIISFQAARIGVLWDDKKSWPNKGKLYLDGLEFERIHNQAPLDADSRIKWLRLQPDDKYFPQPYEQLAKVLKNMGHEEEAKKILIAKNEDPAYLKSMSWLAKRWHKLLGATIGYGHKPWKAMRYVVFFILLGTLLFNAGFKTEVMSPTKSDAYKTIPGTNIQYIRADYPEPYAFMYSLDLFLPIVNFRVAEYWQPNDNKTAQLNVFDLFSIPISGLFLQIYLWFHIALGWLLTSLLVVGLSGLVRR